MAPPTKTALILLNMGGPLDLGEVRQYLYRIFSDRDVIPLPGGKLVQPFLAWMISRFRTPKVQAHYRLIGGASPQLEYARDQREHIASALAEQLPNLKIYIGLRYAKPFISDAIEQAYQEGCRGLTFLPLFPHYCSATTGSAFKAAKQHLKGYPDTKVRYIDDFHDFTGYINLLKLYVEKFCQPDETLLFSAHSVPQRLVDEGDPYVNQVRKTCALAAEKREYFLSFQSRTGPVEWVGPDTVNEVERLLAENRKVFLVPISFVSDHIETLYEIDIELKDYLDVDKRSRLRRMPMFNDDPALGNMLADLFLEKGQSVMV